MIYFVYSNRSLFHRVYFASPIKVIKRVGRLTTIIELHLPFVSQYSLPAEELNLIVKSKSIKFFCVEIFFFSSVHSGAISFVFSFRQKCFHSE